jgi:DNA-binding MarR family transcriptional regulator
MPRSANRKPELIVALPQLVGDDEPVAAADNQHSTRTVSSEQVEAVMAAARALVGISAASIADVDKIVTVPQLRVLMMIATRGPMNLGSVADGLGVSAPNASRICDRLLRAGLLNRREDPADRRSVALSLTADGDRLIDRVVRHRRTAVRRVLRKMTETERDAVAAAMTVFARTAGEPVDAALTLV